MFQDWTIFHCSNVTMIRLNEVSTHWQRVNCDREFLFTCQTPNRKNKRSIQEIQQKSEHTFNQMATGGITRWQTVKFEFGREQTLFLPSTVAVWMKCMLCKNQHTKHQTEIVPHMKCSAMHAHNKLIKT